MSEVLKGETIIYFGPEPWTGLWRNRHQLMSRFAKHNKVFYVEPPTNIRDCLRPGRRSKLFTKDVSGVTVIHGVRWLPVTGRAPFKQVLIRAFLIAISLVSRTAFRGRPIVWFAKPRMVNYVGKLNEKRSIYHVVDEYSGYGQPAAAEINTPDPVELRMLSSVDTVIVVTASLFESKSPHNSNTHIVANAVNFDSYSDNAVSMPDDMIDIQDPVIGYSGLVAARLDLAMLHTAATARPEWSFVFVGTVNDAWCETDLERLRELPNVHMLGTKDVKEVPRYVRQFDVCIIPYVLNLRAQNASPLKLYEYAAASKPIVSTSFAAARDFEGYVHFADDADQLVANCEAAMKLSTDATEILENARIASENTWDHRVRQISKILSADT